ncbi:MAG: Ig-like domain-containing protein, partial [Nitrospirae bacterium]|nr:Ig-like domain-containing protein [Nitrospirota bacterium]
MSPFFLIPPSNKPYSLILSSLFCALLFLATPAGAAQNTLVTWNANDESDLAGYLIYSGTASGIYGSPFNTGLNTFHNFSALIEGLTYYFTVTAYDTSGNESLPSIEISKFIPPSGNDSTTLLLANFDHNSETFSFIDDSFRATHQPTYSNGTYLSSGGFSGGALQIELGGLNNEDILGMSGGWQTTFHLSSPSDVSLSFYYKLSQSSEYESDEFSETLLIIDSFQHGDNGNDYVAHLSGNGNGGGTETTTWQLFQTTVPALSAGTHVLTLGGYNNKKTYANETTEILIDQVTVVRSNEPTPDTTPPSTPGDLSAIPASPTHIALSWNASNDAVGIKEYKISRNNALLATTGNTTYSDSGLTPSTPYDYAVIAYDAAGNASQPGHAAATTPAAPDTTPPSVTLTNPGTGTTVSGLVTLTATATDNVGVVGVQFQINGSSLGSEDTIPPYSQSWDTSGLSPGSYSLTAQAHDAAGNAFLSPPITVTIASEPFGLLAITNLTDQSTKHTYQLIENGMAVGVEMFLDSSRAYAEIPSFLQGASFIKTAKSDRKKTSPDPFVSFSVNQLVTVYIGFDKRISQPPSWLNAFSKTGDTLTTTSDDILEVYGQTFSPGTITLGPNHGNSGTIMYTVIIVGQDSAPPPPPDTTPPSTPGNFLAQTQSSTKIMLTWSASTDNVGVTEYHVFRNNSFISTTTQTTYLDSGLNPDTTYSYSLTALDLAGNESNDTQDFATTGTNSDTTPPSVTLTNPGTGT